jgi:hypothetical protein
MEKLVNGSKLSPSARKQALAAFVHRYTGEHKPAWASLPMPNGKAYACFFKNDEEWLAASEFYVTKDGNLSGNHKHCETRHPNTTHNH